MGDINVKPFKTVEEQVELLKSRGMIINDEQLAKDTLLYINYYRLSAYSLTLRSNDVFSKEATFENVLQLYKFDEELRNCLMKYCSIIEISFRTYISYVHSGKYGPLGYLNNQYFSDEWYHAEFLSKCKKSIKYSKEPFVEHHRKELKGVYPFWVVIETINFDVLSKLYCNLLPIDGNYIASTYCSISREYVESWLKACVDARNISAHGGRFYNRTYSTTKIKLGEAERKIIQPDSPFAKMYGIFMLLPSNVYKKSFIEDIDKIFYRYPFTEPRYLGMPESWKEFLSQYIVPEESEIITKTTVDSTL